MHPDLGRHVTDHALGTITCPLLNRTAFADRLSALLMVGVTSDDRIALNVMIRGFQLDVYFMVAQPRSLGHFAMSPGEWLVRKDTLPPLHMPFLNDTRDAADFEAGAGLAQTFIRQHLSLLVDPER